MSDSNENKSAASGLAAPPGSPKAGETFVTFKHGCCKITSVWLSRFDTWKVSYEEAGGGGGIMNLDYFKEITQPNLRKKARKLNAENPFDLPEGDGRQVIDENPMRFG